MKSREYDTLIIEDSLPILYRQTQLYFFAMVSVKVLKSTKETLNFSTILVYSPEQISRKLFPQEQCQRNSHREILKTLKAIPRSIAAVSKSLWYYGFWRRTASNDMQARSPWILLSFYFHDRLCDQWIALLIDSLIDAPWLVITCHQYQMEYPIRDQRISAAHNIRPLHMATEVS